MTTAIDYSYARPSPDEIARVGAAGVLVYTGPARPDTGYLQGMRAKSLTVCLIQESSPNRSQDGYGAGVEDAMYADRRAGEVGYPLSASIAYVVSDGNANDPNSGAPQIAAYAQGIASVSQRPRFYYGNVYACSAALSGDPHGLGSWIPSSWGNGSLITQEANIASPVGDTDLNTVHAPYGAWGQQGDDMPLDDNDIAKVAAAVGGQNPALYGKATNLGDIYNKLHADVNVLSGKVDKIAAGGGTVDYDILAKKVADLLAVRLAS